MIKLNKDYRVIVRKVLREKLLGNVEKRLELVERLDTKDDTVKKWITPNGTNVPSTVDLPIICEVLNISLNELFDLSDSEISSEAMELYKAFKENTSAQESVKKLLDIK